MTKPWEEEWEQDGQYVKLRGVASILKVRDFGDDGDIARARLASKAPKMARLLRDILREHGAYLPHTAGDIEDVLREAGVLK